MDIDEPTSITIDEPGGKDAHEAGEQHQIRSQCIDFFGQSGIEMLAVREVLVVKRNCRNATAPRKRQTWSIRAIGDHAGDTHGQIGIEERAQIGATAGDKNNDGFHYTR